ncbi:uncharacterized protein LOC125785627 [Astyanax mexicanus]|uniref:uncharacterized protein LOC125785627 n=1 Tax=Astyanax mexicanus TaxID=7994 RepID=UPI0020CB67BC|nr:uncharacterized protein LOC125785627 [Astyanax mexicanus]
MTFQVQRDILPSLTTKCNKTRSLSKVLFSIPLLFAFTVDPGCVSSASDSKDWLQKNFGEFLNYATLTELTDLYANLSTFESLDLLTPSQAAELTLTSGALNSTRQIDQVFNRLDNGDAFENLDEFLTALTDRKVDQIIPAVRDVMMNRTFQIISTEFPEFETSDWIDWFDVKLVPILPSFTAEMLAVAINHTNCTNYRVM